MDNRYTIIRTEEGRRQKGIPKLQMDQILWEPDCGIRAEARIHHDGRSLFIALAAREKNIRAEYISPGSPVYEDSCMEFFFMPEGEDSYMNFEINPNGCLYVGFGRERNGRKLIIPADPQDLFRIWTKRSSDGWEAGFRIPMMFLRQYYPDFDFKGTLKANVYKCGDKTEHSHYLAWNRVEAPAPDFHRPECFGEMIFG